MKILLICPPNWNISGACLSTSPPLGLMYLAAILDLGGHQVKVIDADAEALKLTWQELKATLRKEEPDIVGLTATSLGMPALFKTSDIIKEAQSDSLVIVGGYGPTLETERTLKEGKNIDIVMIGEAEKTILDLVDAYENKKSFNDVKGIAYREGAMTMMTSPQVEIKDLDCLPMPAYHLLEPHYSTYQGVHGKFLKLPNAVMLASRGCPHRCIFCSIKIVKPRFRSPKNIVREMRYLRDELGFKSIQLYDNEFIGMTASQNKWINDLCDEITREGLDDLEFLVQGRCSRFVNLEILKKMKQAGFKWIWWGVESGSQKVLDAMKKDIKVEDVKRCFKLAKKAGIKSMAFIMVGLPKETKEDVALTAKLLKEIKPDKVRIHITTPLPGSELYDLWAGEGKIEIFDLSKYDTRHTVVHHTKEMTSKEIKEMYQLLVFRFEHSKLYFTRILLKSLFSLKEIKKIPRRFKRILIYIFKRLEFKVKT